jgi:hypothetical protein
MQIIMWATLGLVFGGLTERAYARHGAAGWAGFGLDHRMTR